ncbi:hypothetical protein, partial [Faecalibacterium prausnitzii]|uniref:hypothetical protein n=1 Tax=Faecalibacterium prausnitzii TaxID=853 RepID=UPI00290A5D13
PEGSTRRGREEVCRILLHIATKMRILNPKFRCFSLLPTWGGGGTMKMRNTLNKEVQKAQENENVEKERRPLP